LAVPIRVWALAAVEPIAKATTSGSAEIQRPPNFPVFVIALVPKKTAKQISRVMGEESDSRHFNSEKRIFVTSVTFGIERSAANIAKLPEKMNWPVGCHPPVNAR
jgi:hypothetical protein